MTKRTLTNAAPLALLGLGASLRALTLSLLALVLVGLVVVPTGLRTRRT